MARGHKDQEGKYLLDTDIISYQLRAGSPPLSLRMRHTVASHIFVSAISVAELLFGVKGLPHGHPRQVDIGLFLAAANILDWNRGAAEAYADIRYSLSRSGSPVGELDMMIAAHAIATDSILVTNNTRHFERLAPPLRLENWTEA